MTFKIAYYAPDQNHITLHPDGSIEFFNVKSDEERRIVLPYAQAKTLKKMIIAEAHLDNQIVGFARKD